MSKRILMRSTSVLVFCLGLGLLVNQQARGWFEDANSNKEVLNVADLIKNGKNAANKAAAVAKANDLDELMEGFKPRSKGGIGVGRTKGKVTPDGIEQLLLNFEKGAPAASVLANVDELEEMANVIAAMGAIVKTKPNAKGKKILKQWVAWTQELQDNGAALAKAVSKKDGKGISTLSEKINATCSACHMATK